jgi:hypothetical protein
VLGGFVHADPVRSFGLDQVAFVDGSRWKQRSSAGVETITIRFRPSGT